DVFDRGGAGVGGEPHRHRRLHERGNIAAIAEAVAKDDDVAELGGGGAGAEQQRRGNGPGEITRTRHGSTPDRMTCYVRVTLIQSIRKRMLRCTATGRLEVRMAETHAAASRPWRSFRSGVLSAEAVICGSGFSRDAL